MTILGIILIVVFWKEIVSALVGFGSLVITLFGGIIGGIFELFNKH